MTLKDLFTGNVSKNSMDRKAFSLLTTLVVVVGIFLAAGILFPTTVSVILNIFWIIITASVVVFFVLGILVIFGMRKEASRILDILLEGSLTFIDFLEFLKNVWKRFVEMLKEFLLFAAPIFAYVTDFLIYVLLLYVYKTVGKDHDVTLMTIIISFVAITGFGLLNKPKNEDTMELTWKGQFGNRFRSGLVDGSEVILFVFFLTMDSTHLFFLPNDLNIPLKAEFGSYDLMIRSFVYNNHLKITGVLIIISVCIEVLRNLLRIYAHARRHYAELSAVNTPEEGKKSTIELLKDSIRKSFNDSKDDLIRFVTFNTVLFAVFLLFPRLKLLTLVVASITNFTLDIFMRSRLTAKKGRDLISRLLGAIFKL